MLLIGAAGHAWCNAAMQASARLGVSLDAFRVANSGEIIDPRAKFAAAFGISTSGAVLLRPDGFIAWRAASDTAIERESLCSVLATVLYLVV